MNPCNYQLCMLLLLYFKTQPKRDKNPGLLNFLFKNSDMSKRSIIYCKLLTNIYTPPIKNKNNNKQSKNCCNI